MFGKTKTRTNAQRRIKKVDLLVTLFIMITNIRLIGQIGFIKNQKTNYHLPQKSRRVIPGGFSF
jgi:hypothetical protein